MLWRRPLGDSDPTASVLRPVLLPHDCLDRFQSIASINTAQNQETCGLLFGIDYGWNYKVTTLLIPKQHATSDTCGIDEEVLVKKFKERGSSVILGWIHTHPTKSCFMSSIDLHMHSGFQRVLPDSIAVVCAPNSTPNFRIFRLTDPPGIQIITECHATEGFHPHPEHSIYTGVHHVQISVCPLEIVDLREHTVSHRPLALLSDDTLGFFEGSLSGYHAYGADHNGEKEEEVVTHAARRNGSPQTPKLRPVALPPFEAPAQGSNVPHESKFPSINHRDALPLSTDTSLPSGAVANDMAEVSERFDMHHRTPESQLHGQQLDYRHILQNEFGTPGPGRDHGPRYSDTDDAGTFNEGDSFVDSDNESHNDRLSVDTVSDRSFLTWSNANSVGSQETLTLN